MQRPSFIGLSIIVTLFSATTLAQPVGQAPLTSLTHRIDSIVNTAIKADLIPGAVVQIHIKNRDIYTHAYGLAQKYDIHRQPLTAPPPMTENTLFDLASLTKVVGTTTSIMLLVDQHKISVDDPVSKYLPGFDTGAKRAITLRHLLTHTAGLYEWYPLFYKSKTRDSTIKLIESLPLKYPVGQQRKYSDLGFILLGAIIEKVSGLPLDQFEQQNIFQPLGMTHTGYNPLKASHPTTDIAATSLGNPYETRMTHDPALGFLLPGINPNDWDGWRHYVLKGEVNDGNAWYANEGIAGHAGLFSTAEDLQKLVDMLLNSWSNPMNSLISSGTIQEFLFPDSFHNGLGWMMDPDNSFMKKAPNLSFGHTGFTGTSIVAVPEYRLSIIILINRQNIGLQPNGTYYNPNPIRQAIFEATMKAIKEAGDTRQENKEIFDKSINRDSLFQAILQSLPESRRAGFQQMYTEQHGQERDFVLFMMAEPYMGKYYFNLFSKPLTAAEIKEYNDDCRYIYYKNKIVLEYGGGAAGPQCFPKEDQTLPVSKPNNPSPLPQP